MSYPVPDVIARTIIGVGQSSLERDSRFCSLLCAPKTAAILSVLVIAWAFFSFNDEFVRQTPTLFATWMTASPGRVRNSTLLTLRPSELHPEGSGENSHGGRLYAGMRSSPQDPPPLSGLVTTHHKTGTTLFASMLQEICSTTKVDFQWVPDEVTIGNSTFGTSIRYLAHDNADKRILFSMHGLKETCSGEYKCDRFNASCRLSACSLTDGGGETYGVAHVVRHPMETLISAYLYHRERGSELVKHGAEQWLLEDKSHLFPAPMRNRFKGVPYYQVLENMTMAEGLRAEFFVNGAQLFQAARNYRDLKSRSGVLNIRFEDLQDDFRGTVKKVFEVIHLPDTVPINKLLKIATVHDIHNMPKDLFAKEAAPHMTAGKFDKSVPRKVISDDKELSNVLQHLAREMGYD